MDIASLLREILDDAKYGEICELAAGNPDTDSSIPPKNGSCPWNLLLRELRDAIFEYTYAPRSDALKILYKERDKSTRLRSGGSRKVGLMYAEHAYTSLARQPWLHGRSRSTLTLPTSFCFSNVTSTDSSFASNGHPKLPRLCSPSPSYASRRTSQGPSSRAPAWLWQT